MKFGTSGLRGLVSDMTDDACAAWTAAFLAHLAGQGARPAALLVGMDRRPSSPRIAAAVRGAARRAGVEAVDLGVLPTPALALLAARRGWPAVMVTGSHIPFDRNGLKFYRPDGEIGKADEAGILAAMDAPAPAAATPAGARAEADAAAAYVDRLVRFFPAQALVGWRVGVWRHSAAGRDVTDAALRALGAETVPLGETEGFVAVDTEAVNPADEAQARAWAAEHGLHALVSTDGDGDRPLVADETGAFLRGDILGVLTAKALGADAVATPINANTALERSGWFARTARTRIGSPYVIEGMERLAADGARLVAGFEANGGFLLGGEAVSATGARLEPLPTRDALTPMLAVLVMAATHGVALSRLTADLPARATASDRIQETPTEASQALIARMTADAATRDGFLAAAGLGPTQAVDLTDGLRMTLTGDEIVHLRPSGNAPELRAYAEAADGVRAAALVAAMLAQARARIGA
jgi:phosphomannomutase